MKILFNILVPIATLLYIGGLQVSFSPFSVSLPKWILSLGWLFLGIGFILIMAYFQHEGWKDGYTEASKDLLEVVKEEINSKHL